MHVKQFKLHWYRKIVLSVLALFLFGGTIWAQNIRVSGTVTDASSGDLVSQATVRLKESTTAVTFTDENGNYTLSVPANGTLVFSIIGYKTLEINVNNRSRIDVELTVDNTFLDDVVVVAYGVAKKESITGSISTVSSRAIENRSMSSVAGVLEGQAAGVIVNNSIGDPGSSPTIRIRGISTYNGNNSPLYVVDGVPYGGNITDLNPQDIESMSVLKDAASSALYGSRASNGVIIITTKRGKSDRVSIRANITQGVYTRGIPEYDRLGADDFMETMWIGLRNQLLTNTPTLSMEEANSRASAQLIPTYLRYNIYNKPDDQLFDANGKLVAGAQIRPQYDDLDWWKYLQRMGYRQEYTVSGDAASEKSSFYFSAGFLDEQGYIKHSGFQRFTGLSNITVTPVKWLKTTFRLNGSSQKYQNTSTSNTGYINPWYYARNMSPIYPVYLHDLETGDFILDANGQKQYDRGSNDPNRQRPQNLNRHVIWEKELDTDNSLRNTLGAQLMTDIKFLNDFTFSVKADVSYRNVEDRSMNNSIIGDGTGNNGRLSTVEYVYKTYTFAQQLTWQKGFGRHEVDALVAHENFEEGYSNLDTYTTTEVFPGMDQPVNYTNITRINGASYLSRIESYLARARYNYDGKYFLEASIRRDGSSRFYKENRWGNFFSIGGSWSIHREPFMASIKEINALKLRASYGAVGNDNSVGRYGWMGLYTLSQNANLGASYKSQNEAISIQWESLASIDVAIEGRAFDRVNFVLDYFDKRSVDLLFPVNNPLSAGATSNSSMVSTQTKNLGTISNSGFELSFDVDILKNRNFKWNVGFNAATLKNKIISLPEENREEGIIDGTKKLVEGRGLYEYWTYQFVGIDQMTGNCLYLVDDERYYVGNNPEGDKTQVPDQYAVTIGGKGYTTYTTYAKRDWEGTALPKLYGSISTFLSWKNLDLNVLCTWAWGGKMFDQSYNSLTGVTANPAAIHKDVLKAWNGIPAGMTENSPDRIDPNGFPVTDWVRSTYNNATSSRTLSSSAYFVLKNVSLTYHLPRNLSNKIDMQNLSVNIGVENLMTLTAKKGFSPQQSINGNTANTFVPNRTITLGLNLRF